ncbi:MAG TPA: flagellar basal-body rod protein FlgG [Spirochaetota bacterium]|nr:flagellar basal-body rod protein FlgG [Spirochaetota bacterium]MBP9022096.1 flagellar basal-body rod protein FlgG [Spirochaetota bacterium]HOA07536.1 flagellar basal-body rod protein FlgG [Spirochaetota bacterium]HOF32704.1 flagellar basal-body rod protein FlgG [Spirochaetota bacterium]HOH37315.1 flagellar basal-body rod protein FlgG [Spirochaetota bacterium]
MMRSLWTAASGMTSQQFHIDTISNNLANVNTYGFKKMRAEFEDLIYQTELMAGTPATEITEIPTGIQVGHGARVSATQKMFQQGSLQSTENKTDIALEGEGFFKVLLYDGSEAYTRDGSFKVDSNRQLVTSNGYLLEPPVVLPEDFIMDTLSISKDGRISVNVIGDEDPVEVGTMEIYRFVNPAGLSSIGSNLYKTTAASGEEIPGQPGMNGMAKVHQGFLEMSNVKVVEEMVNMIVAQRAYETNSKAIQTSDSMLATAIGLKR